MHFQRKVLINFFAILALFSPTANFADPPIQLPTITVIGMSQSLGPTLICMGPTCADILGLSGYDALMSIAEEAMPDGGEYTTYVLIKDIPDNPYNQNPDVNCSSDGEARIAHAITDIAPQIGAQQLRWGYS